MLKDTIDKTKFKILVRQLSRFGETERSVIGLLELLWRTTSINAPRGNIGRLSDEGIAAHLQWDHDPTELVSALVSARWLDSCALERLVVHDWQEYAPNWVLALLKRKGWEFCLPTEAGSLVVTGEPTSVTTEAATHSLAQPSLAQPSLIHTPASGVAGTAPAGAAAGVRGGRDLRDRVRRSRKASQDPKPKSPTKHSYEPAFETFWSVYPRRLNKAEAYDAWQLQLKLGRSTVEEMQAAVEQYAVVVSGQNPRYLPFAARWIKAAKWLDDQKQWLDESQRLEAQQQEALEAFAGGNDDGSE